MHPFVSRLSQLHAFLERHQSIWRPRAFCDREAPWLEASLRDWLASLSWEAIEAYQQTPPPLEEFHPTLRALHKEASALTQFPRANPERWPAWESDPRATLAPAARRYTPGRKLLQLAAIADRTAHWMQPTPVIDWCGGKGHLGRAIGGAWKSPIRVVERDASVIADGQQLHQQFGVETQFFQRDVMREDCGDVFEGAGVVYALHACGELSATLAERLPQTDVQRALLMPCCPHFTGEHSYWRPISAHGAQHPLQLTTPDLKLAIADEVVARPAIRAARRQEQLWRLCADVLLRQALGVEDYVTVGMLPPRAFRGELRDFIEAVFSARGLVAPSSAAIDTAERDAEEELRLVQAFGLTRAVFRRPLEVFILLDRALFFHEHGWVVTIEELFPRTASPRNLAIIAERDHWNAQALTQG